MTFVLKGMVLAHYCDKCRYPLSTGRVRVYKAVDNSPQGFKLHTEAEVDAKKGRMVGSGIIDKLGNYVQR